jgi:hypothetical protein
LFNWQPLLPSCLVSSSPPKLPLHVSGDCAFHVKLYNWYQVQQTARCWENVKFAFGSYNYQWLKCHEWNSQHYNFFIIQNTKTSRLQYHLSLSP